MRSTAFRMKTMIRVNALIMVVLAVYCFIGPGLIVLSDLADPALRSRAIPRAAWRSHRYLAPRYARWARARVASGAAGTLDLYDVPSTEWPIFGSVYYLWATDNLQRAWERGEGRSTLAPAVYAADAIEACVDLIMDPVHHAWVRTHWGPDYMHNQNAFFRSLIIAGLTSYEHLTGNRAALALHSAAAKIASRLANQKLLQLLPVLGGAVGAGLNFHFTYTVSRAAVMAYRYRWLTRRFLQD